MNTLSVDLLKELECRICHNYLRSPISQCRNGHCICGPCRDNVTSSPVVPAYRVPETNDELCAAIMRDVMGRARNSSIQSCPVCRADFSDTRCLILENIIPRLIVPCSNQSKGCMETMILGEIGKHLVICHWQLQNCPLNQLGVPCSWTGNTNKIKDHLSGKHSARISNATTASVTILQDRLHIFFAFDNTFIYYQTDKENKSHCVMLVLGTEQEASRYKCVFTMKASNGVEGISETRLVRSFTDTVDDICKPCKCFLMDNITRQNVIKNDKLTINISPVD